MEEKYEKIARFLTACDEMIQGKFILADTKIGEILKAIALSEELKILFSSVTKRFDYQTAKFAYLRFPADPSGMRGAAYLPTDGGDLLAFVFCLLIDFDSGRIRFNDFLLRYFYVDGSYTESYSVFVQKVIRPFRDEVNSRFPELTGMRSATVTDEDAIGKIAGRVILERERIRGLPVPEKERAAGDLILAELYAAAGRKEIPEMRALCMGYLFYLRCVGGESAESAQLFSLSEKL